MILKYCNYNYSIVKNVKNICYVFKLYKKFFKKIPSEKYLIFYKNMNENI